jgi:hypothetical protein
VILQDNPAKLQEFSTFPANQPVKMQGQGRKKRGASKGNTPQGSRFPFCFCKSSK